MPSLTWTPDALSSEAIAIEGSYWRLVEAQHHVSTLKLVDTLEEQRILEELLETTKPRLPPECRHLHYLLATPFRYGAAYPQGSRFRRAGSTPGVFYAAEAPRVAVAEMAFYRLLFYAESPRTPWPKEPAEYTAFAAAVRTRRALDLTAPALARDAAVWTHLTDYAPCQALAETARGAGIEAILYRSVRDPGQGLNLALLACRAFAKPEPVDRQTWRLRVGATGVQALCAFPPCSIEFAQNAFASDPRLAGMAWLR